VIVWYLENLELIACAINYVTHGLSPLVRSNVDIRVCAFHVGSVMCGAFDQDVHGQHRHWPSQSSGSNRPTIPRTSECQVIRLTLVGCIVVLDIGGRQFLVAFLPV
jgi:hypothetical protein